MDYYKILHRSWEIVRKEKILWIFGAVLAAFSGGGVGSGFSGNWNAGSGSDFFQKEIPEKKEEITQVLGAVTSDPLSYFSTLLSQIPISFWLALGIGVLILVFFGIVFSTFIRSWSEGALFTLTLKKLQGGELTLKEGSNLGRHVWLRLFLSSLIIWGGFIITVLTAILTCGILLVILPSFFKVIIAIILSLFALAAIVFAFIAVIWVVFVKIVITLEDFSLRKSLIFSWKLTKKFFMDGAVMGFINNTLGCLTGCATVFIIGIGVGIIGVGFLIHKSVGIFSGFMIGIPLLLLILGGVFIQGIVKAFTTCNWVLFYEEIKKNEKFPKVIE